MRERNLSAKEPDVAEAEAAGSVLRRLDCAILT